MIYCDFAVIGSGPSGISAARKLAGKSIIVFDVGQETNKIFKYDTLDKAVEAKDISELLGENLEFLHNIFYEDQKHMKLRHPNTGYAVNGEEAHFFDKNNKKIIKTAGSYASGGMSNIWGGQLIRYTDNDFLKNPWPISLSSLNHYYDDLENHIGISGEKDDMYDYFGESKNLIKPPPLTRSAEYLLKNYKESKKNINELGFFLGRPRLGLNVSEKTKKLYHDLGETEFFASGQKGLYTSKVTLDELVRKREIQYMSGYKLLKYKERDDYVELKFSIVPENRTIEVKTRNLILACGGIHTSRLVLQNNNAYSVKLNFKEHPPALIPLFIPKLFGNEIPKKSFPIQLAATQFNKQSNNMISIYYPGGMLYSDLIMDMPLPINLSYKVLQYLMGGLLVAQIWEEPDINQKNYLSIDEFGSIVINYCEEPHFGFIPLFLKSMRNLGVYSLMRFSKLSPPGWGFHYASTLPMKIKPEEFETFTDGRLWNSERIRVVDASVLPSLAAKNHSLTMMANAARIAKEIDK